MIVPERVPVVAPPHLNAALCLLASGGLFAAMGALVKLAGTRFGVGEMMFHRGGFATLILLGLAPAQGGWSVFRTSRPVGHLLRSIAGLGGMAFTFAALTMLPLAEAAALGFASPLLTAALAGPLLGERVGLRRWLAVLAGFLGVIVIVRPGAAAFSWGAPLALSGAFCGALAMLSIRRLGGTERGLTVALYYQILCALAGALSLFWQATAPTWPEFVGLAGIGVVGGLAQIFMTRA